MEHQRTFYYYLSLDSHFRWNAKGIKKLENRIENVKFRILS